MGVVASLIIFAAGAVMRFAVTVTSPDFNVRTVGAILMIVGAVGFALSLAAWGTWGGIGTFRRERRVVRRQRIGTQPPGSGDLSAPSADYVEEEVRHVS